jgi:hypothetical protein
MRLQKFAVAVGAMLPMLTASAALAFDIQGPTLGLNPTVSLEEIGILYCTRTPIYAPGTFGTAYIGCLTECSGPENFSIFSAVKPESECVKGPYKDTFMDNSEYNQKVNHRIYQD